MGRKQNNKHAKAARRRRQKLRARQSYPPQLGHETMLTVEPSMRRAVKAVIGKLQRAPGAPPELMKERDLALPEVDEFLKLKYFLARDRNGWSHESCITEVEQLWAHMECAINFVLGGRKAFWVAPELIELLTHTTLDISGDLLKLPFPACAFIFKDRPTLDLARTIADGTRGNAPMCPPFEVVTAYVFPIPEEEGESGVRVTFLFDAFDGAWPYLVNREIPTIGTRSIEEILGSHPQGIEDPFFYTPELRKLVHLLINAVLYTTSDGFRQERRPPGPPSITRRGKYSPVRRSTICPARSPSATSPRRRTQSSRTPVAPYASASGCVGTGDAPTQTGTTSACAGSPVSQGSRHGCRCGARVRTRQCPSWPELRCRRGAQPTDNEQDPRLISNQARHPEPDRGDTPRPVGRNGPPTNTGMKRPSILILTQRQATAAKAGRAPFTAPGRERSGRRCTAVRASATGARSLWRRGT